MGFTMLTPVFKIERDYSRCIKCEVCVTQCSNDVHYTDEDKILRSDDDKCVNCQRCAVLCPTKAIGIRPFPLDFTENKHWSSASIREIYDQAENGGVLLSGMGNPRSYKSFFEHLLLNAIQVTNPAVTQLQKPIELTTCLGNKTDGESGMPNPFMKLEVPILFPAMSLGAVSLNVHKSLAMAAQEIGTYWNTGQGGLHNDLKSYRGNTIVQIASGRMLFNAPDLFNSAAIEIKIGPGSEIEAGRNGLNQFEQEAAAGKESHIAGTAAENQMAARDLTELIQNIRVVTGFHKPILVKVAAADNISSIASEIIKAGTDILVIDGFRGGNGTVHMRMRDNVGIPIEIALAQVDKRLREEGIRQNASLVISGGIRSSADLIKALALGADAVYIGTAALIALGCHMCQTCYTGKCNWGICTTRPELSKRLNPEIGKKRLMNLIQAWGKEIQEMIGGMGIDSLESLRGNRTMLRGIGLSKEELELLGVKPVGE